MDKRFTWKRGQFGTEYGYIGGVRIASISFGVAKNEKPYVLRMNLPGFEMGSNESTSADAKTQAEKNMVRFLTKIGAEFK
jgi:hypothetical protein